MFFKHEKLGNTSNLMTKNEHSYKLLFWDKKKKILLWRNKTKALINS